MLIAGSCRAYVCRDLVDMRNGVDSLSCLVEPLRTQHPMSGHLFVFVGRDRRKVKTLYLYRTGFALWYKRLERGRFPAPESLTQRGLSVAALHAWLEGVDIPLLQPHPPAVLFQFTESREAIHPATFLVDYQGYLQADAYSGHSALYRGWREMEVGCWAHSHSPCAMLRIVGLLMKRVRFLMSIRILSLDFRWAQSWPMDRRKLQTFFWMNGHGAVLWLLTQVVRTTVGYRCFTSATISTLSRLRPQA